MDEIKGKVEKSLVVVPYDPKWGKCFEREAKILRVAMGEICLDVVHVGSTSVEGLSAKPIIDIILVTSNLQQARKLLTEKLGYRYKGEYNLPLRDLYGKKEEYEIYLHVHLPWNEEIRLNVAFRDYLRSHPAAKKAYELVKVQASQTQGAAKKTSTGITQYNLLKNDQIVSILEAVGFDGLCVRFVTQREEHQAFDFYKKEFFNSPIKLQRTTEDIKKFVIYKGAKIEGAAELFIMGTDRYLLNFLNTQNKESDKRLLRVILLWLKERFAKGIVLAKLLDAQIPLFLESNFDFQGLDSKLRIYKASKRF